MVLLQRFHGFPRVSMCPSSLESSFQRAERRRGEANGLGSKSAPLLLCFMVFRVVLCGYVAVKNPNRDQRFWSIFPFNRVF